MSDQSPRRDTPTKPSLDVRAAKVLNVFMISMIVLIAIPVGIWMFWVSFGHVRLIYASLSVVQQAQITTFGLSMLSLLLGIRLVVQHLGNVVGWVSQRLRNSAG